MFVQLSGLQNGTEMIITGVLLQYQDPIFSSVVTSPPTKRYDYEVGRTSLPPVMALAVMVKDNNITYKKVEAFLKKEEDRLVLVGLPEAPKPISSLCVDFKKYAAINEEISKIAHEAGEPTRIPCHTINEGKVGITWVKCVKNLTTPAAYVGALSIAVALQTCSLVSSVLRYQLPFVSEFDSQPPPQTDLDRLFWIFLPSPRPPSLIRWLRYLEKAEDPPSWSLLSPLTEGFYLSAIDAKGASSVTNDWFTDENGHEWRLPSEAVIRFVGGGLPVDAKVEYGIESSDVDQTPSIFSERARLNGCIQIAFSPPGAGVSGSISWGSHSDQRPISILPYRKDFDIRKYGPVRTPYSVKVKSHPGKLENPPTIELNRRVLVDAEEENIVLPSFPTIDLQGIA